MGEKTKDTQWDVFIEGEKLILGVCSRRQRDREGVGRALHMREQQHARLVGQRLRGGGESGERDEESVRLSACECVRL